MRPKNEDTTEIEMSYPENAFEGFVGKSHKAREVKYMAYKASKNRFNVIITGRAERENQNWQGKSI